MMLYAAARMPYWMASSDEIASGDILITKFEESVFNSEFEYKPNKIYRWEGQVNIFLSGGTATIYHSYIDDLAAHLTRITARNVNHVKNLSAIEPNIIVFLAPHREMADRLSFNPHAQQVIKDQRLTGYGIAGGDGIELRALFAAVRDDASELRVRKTLLEEITQGFGPINDSEIVQPSIWSDTGPIVDRLPLNDQIILRALYDPAIRPGMPKDEAMAVIRDLIPKLVAAVKQDGEKALYQR